MTILFRRLHGIFFCTSLFSSRTSFLSSRTSFLSSRSCISTTPKLLHGKPYYRSDSVLFKERDLRKLVDKFKSFCVNRTYRKNHKRYIEIVRRLAAAKQFSWIEEIFEDQKKYCVADVGFVTRIISLYGKAGMFNHARKLFDEMPLLDCDRSVSTFNLLLDLCVESKKYDEIGRIFREIPPQLSITPNLLSYNLLIKAYTKMGRVDDSLLAVDEMETKSIKPDSITYGFILDGLYQGNRIQEASMIWKSLDSKGIIPCLRCYTSKLRHLVAKKNMTGAVKFFQSLGHKRLKPDAEAYCILFEGLRNERNFDEAKKFYQGMLLRKCDRNEFIYHILVPFAMEMRDFEFAHMLCLDAINILAPATLQGVVDGLVKKGMFEKAKQLVDIVKESSSPAEVSMSSI